MSIKVYEYSKCSTCRDALKFLDKKNVKYNRISIVDHPPSLADLKRMLVYLKNDGGTIKSLFNTSGIQYRELSISEKFKSGLSEDQALQLLTINGMLVKRPFLLTAAGGAVGFKSAQWEKLV